MHLSYIPTPYESEDKEESDGRGANEYEVVDKQNDTPY